MSFYLKFFEHCKKKFGLCFLVLQEVPVVHRDHHIVHGHNHRRRVAAVQEVIEVEFLHL